MINWHTAFRFVQVERMKSAKNKDRLLKTSLSFMNQNLMIGFNGRCMNVFVQKY